MMKAVVIDAPGKYGIRDVADPRCPAEGMVVRVLACGLCGSDLRTLRSGHHRVTLPFIVGHEICGVVHETGVEYRGPWKEGDTLSIAPLVYCGSCDFCRENRLELCENYREIGQHWEGGFAQFIAIPADAVSRGTILPVPSGLDPEIAAVAEPISSCVHAQEKGVTGKGDTVAVLGSGPIGCIHVQLARARGARRIIIVDVNESRLRLCEPFAPDHIVDGSKVDIVEEIMRITGGKGCDCVITANPVPESQVQALEMARKGGRILLFGGLPKDKSRPGVDTNLIHYNALSVIGTTIFAPRHQQIALDMLAAGEIDGNKLVTHRFALEKFNEGASLALEGKVLKAVFIP